MTCQVSIHSHPLWEVNSNRMDSVMSAIQMAHEIRGQLANKAPSMPRYTPSRKVMVGADLVSTMYRMSPMGFSGEYMPPCSSSCRTISLVTCSDHAARQSTQSLHYGSKIMNTDDSRFFLFCGR